MITRGARGWGAIRRLPSGRLQASYIGPDGTRHYAPSTFDDRDAAVFWLARERRRVEAEEWTSPKDRARAELNRSLTLEEYARTWIEERELSPRTRALYSTHLDKFIAPTLGPLPLHTLAPTVIRGWFTALTPDRPTQRAQVYRLLHAVLTTAESDGLIARNPCVIRGAATARRARRIEPATVAELHGIADAMPERLRLLILLCGWCALRFGEVIELRRSDVDLRAGTIRVARAASKVGGRWIVGKPKTAAGTRTVAVPPHILPMLKQHLRVHAQKGPDGLIFPSRAGIHLDTSTLARHFRRARASVGRTDLTVHGLRHTGATLAAQSGATLAELMARLGHASPAAAMIYQHAAAGRDREIADKLSAMAADAIAPPKARPTE